MLIDLDNFKDYNGVFGHNAGDELLARIGRCLRARLREGDAAGRLGGDEFVVLVRGADRRAAESVAQMLMTSIAATASALMGVSPKPVTGSVGIADFQDVRPETVEQAIGRADSAMYEAKRLGKSRLAVAASDATTHVMVRNEPSWSGKLDLVQLRGKAPLR